MRAAYREELQREGLTEEAIDTLAARIEPHLGRQAVDAANRVIYAAGNGTEAIGIGAIKNYIKAMAGGKAEAAVKAAMRILALARDDAARDSARQTIEDVLSGERLDLWADASTQDAAGFGSYTGARRSGAAQKVWVHNRSKNPRAGHAVMAGERVDIDGTFSNGMRWPHDWSATGDPDDIIGCHCDIAYVW